MKYGLINRKTAQIIADSLALNIVSLEQNLKKAEELEISELTVMLVRYHRKELKEIKQLKQNILEFARSFEFGKTYYDKDLRPIVSQSLRYQMNRKIKGAA